MDKEQAEALKTLKRARKLVARKQGWVKQNERVPLEVYNGPADFLVSYDYTNPPLGFAYCTIGAIRHADGPGEKRAFALIRQAIGILFYGGKKRVGDRGIYQFNDRKQTVQADVVAAFDKAIELAQAE